MSPPQHYPAHQTKTKDYAKNFFRKIAPAKFARSTSDPCINVNIVEIKDTKHHSQDTRKLRKRRDTGDPRPRTIAESSPRGKAVGKDEGKETLQSQEITKECPTQERADPGKVQREDQQKLEYNEQLGRQGLIRSSPDPRTEYSKFQMLNFTLDNIIIY